MRQLTSIEPRNLPLRSASRTLGRRDSVRTLRFVLATVAMIAALVPALALAQEDPADQRATPADRVFEMRVYTTSEGNLDALHARFRDHTCRLFEKHGMELIGFWVPQDEERSKNTLVYILAYPSRDAREASWKAFLADPEWQRVYKESHEAAGGPIVTKVESTFMSPTDYSAIR